MTLCPVTSHAVDAALFRVPLAPGSHNGLRFASQAMADKITTLRCDRVGAVVDHLVEEDMERIEAAVMLWLDLKP